MVYPRSVQKIPRNLHSRLTRLQIVVLRGLDGEVEQEPEVLANDYDGLRCYVEPYRSQGQVGAQLHWLECRTPQAQKV